MIHENLVEDLFLDIANYTGTSIQDLKSKSRKKEFVRPRMFISYILKLKTKMILKDIGKEIGGVDHSTVLNHIEVVNNWISLPNIYREENALLNYLLNKYSSKQLDGLDLICAKELDRESLKSSYIVDKTSFNNGFKLGLNCGVNNLEFNIKNIQSQYEYVCDQYIKIFCDKQDIEFDGWIGNEIGGLAAFASQYFFKLSDIILDINSNQTRHKILKWQNENIDFNIDKEKPQYINYKSYTMGLKHKDLNKKTKRIKKIIMSEIKKANASLIIHCTVECPHCEEVFDLFGNQNLCDDGYIYTQILGDTFGKKDWGEIVECEHCKEKVNISDVEW